jgi:hypothetical protein
MRHPDECGHVEGTPEDCGCEQERNHSRCGIPDACGHVVGSPSDPGCESPGGCEPTRSCQSEGFECGTLFDGRDSIDCGQCDNGYTCTVDRQCSCAENPTQTCGWVTRCGQRIFLGDCNPNDCIDDYTETRIDYCCSPACGDHPNDECQRDGSCPCSGTCGPGRCGNDDGCGRTCTVGCTGGPCNDSDGDCYDDCTEEWVCEGSSPCGDSDGDCYGDCSMDWVCSGPPEDDGGGPTWCSTRPGCLMCGGPGDCAYEDGGNDESCGIEN